MDEERNKYDLTDSKVELYQIFSNKDVVDVKNAKEFLKNKTSQNDKNTFDPANDIVEPDYEYDFSNNADVLNGIVDEDEEELDLFDRKKTHSFDEFDEEPKVDVEDPEIEQTPEKFKDDGETQLSRRDPLMDMKNDAHNLADKFHAHMFNSLPLEETSKEKERQMMLHEMKLLLKQNPSIPEINYVNDDSDYEDVQLALMQVKTAIDVESGAEMLKDGLKIMATGLEWVAPKVSRNNVVIDGWSSEVSSDIDNKRYNAILCQIYKRYWRTGGTGLMSNPAVQLGFMLTTSAGMFAFKNKFMGGSKPRESRQEPPNYGNESDRTRAASASSAYREDVEPAPGKRLKKPSAPQGNTDTPGIGLDSLNGIDLSQMAGLASMMSGMMN